MKQTAIIVLAAGASKRMHTPKQLLKIKSKTLLDIVLEKAVQIAPKNTFCVLGAYADEVQQQLKTVVPFIKNNNYVLGLSESIKTAFAFFEKRQLRFDSVLILLGDQPAIGKDYLIEMIQKQNEYPGKIIASQYGNKKGVPALFPQHYFSILKSLSGDFGAKEMMKQHQGNIISMKLTTNLIDLDTEADYKMYLHQIE